MNERRRSNSSTDETWRLFIAVPLPSAVREFIREIEGQLKARSWPVKWVDPELAHITLKFLGDTQTDRVPAIERELESVAAKLEGAEGVVGGVGAFPSTSRARIIWLGLDGDLSPLGRLARDVDSTMSGIGFAPEARPFRPHITLGRLRQGKTLPADFADTVEVLNIPSMSVPLDRVQLVRSVLGRVGPTYTTLSEWPLPIANNDVVPVELVEHG